MAQYLVKDRFFDGMEVREPGETIEYTGLVRAGVDTHLELIDTPKNKAKADAEAKSAEDDDRLQAMEAKLTEDGKASGKPIDEKTPIDLVRLRLAEFKQGNSFS